MGTLLSQLTRLYYIQRHTSQIQFYWDRESAQERRISYTDENTVDHVFQVQGQYCTCL